MLGAGVCAAAASSSLPPKLVMKVIFSGPGVRERDRDSELDSDSGLRNIIKKKINRKKFKHTSRQKKSGHLRGKYEVNLPFIGVVRWAVSPGIAEKQEYDDITSTCAEISQLIR